MSEIASIHRYPLTGARAESLEFCFLDHNGIIGDRYFLLYNPKYKAEGSDRISQKQFPKLAQLTASYDRVGDIMEVSFPDGGQIEAPVSDSQNEDWVVNEFGDTTPIIDNWYWQSRFITAYLGTPVRLGQKSAAWLLDTRQRFPNPADRRVAPLHIITKSSVNELQRRATTTDFGAERFRPNLVVDIDHEPFSENDWVGITLKIGELTIAINRSTKRCPVPGYDQFSGENKKDVPKLYRDLAKSPDDHKALFGVYGYPVLKLGAVGLIGIGDKVTVH